MEAYIYGKRESLICCRACSQLVFDLKGTLPHYWNNPAIKDCDGVYVGGWQDTIDQVKAMGIICPQCGDKH
jgi:hypothetical protein